MKNKTDLYKSKKLGNKSTYKNNAYIHLDSKINQKKKRIKKVKIKVKKKKKKKK